MKSLLNVYLVALLLGGVFLTGGIQYARGQSSTNVTGILGSDTTWTIAGSPYVFTGPVGIGEGATLTVDPGVTVNMGSYYLIVNGTLQAKGTGDNPVYFNVGTTGMLNPVTLNYAITFNPSSSSWNEQTASGCIIQNAVLNGTTIAINGASPKIFNDTIDGSIRIRGDYPIGTPIISNNTITAIIRPWGVPDVPIEDDSMDYTIITNNTLTNFPQTATTIGLSPGVNNIVSGNVIFDSYFGISGGRTDAVISNNIITNCQIGIAFNTADNGSVIENNLITNCYQTAITLSSGPLTIRNNTIANSSVAIQPSAASTIIFNNIENNNQTITLAGVSIDINATYNWWGTTNTPAINQTIHDFKNDFNLGTVLFVPFLNAPNPEAGPNASKIVLPVHPTPTIAPIPGSTPMPSQSATSSANPSLSPSQNPTSSPTPPQPKPVGINIYEILIAALVVLVVAFTVVIVLLMRGRRR